MPDSGESLQTGANVSLGIGLAGLVVGAVLIGVGSLGGSTTPSEPPSTSAPTARWNPWLDPARGVVGVGRAF